MPDFRELFDEWAPHYDDTVYDIHHEYREVFEGYDTIFSTIVDELQGLKRIVDIGAGTGNLSKLLVQHGFDVIGVDPSAEMREIFKEKLPEVPIIDGHFLDLAIEGNVDAIVASYAFHHLTYEEKKEAFTYLDRFLNDQGKLIIADTMFESKDYKNELFHYVEESNAYNLLNDLKSEFYEELDDILKLFKDHHYTVTYKKMNKYVWLVTGVKGGN